jgi:hypothetical protein
VKGAQSPTANSLKLKTVGGRDRDRTGDPLLAKQVLSQLSYTPTGNMYINFRAFMLVRKPPLALLSKVP